MERNMKLIKVFIGVIIFFTSIAFPTTVNGRFTVVQIDSLEFTVLLQLNTGTGTDDLGGATIVFGIDTTAISFTNNPVKDVDYTFHNFDLGNYSSASLTRPMTNQIWVNIDLPFINNNDGTVVAENPTWTDVVTIHFDVIDPDGMASLIWLTTSPFWGIYDANNSTLWQTGQFDDLFGPLPVELISFTGKLLSNNNVLLEWKTASSLNNSGFEVQKSYSNSKEWEAIGFVENYGNPNSLVEYSFTDYTSHRSPIIKYRLKSIDNDGSYQYSQIIEINTLPSSYELSQNYPNPFNPSTKIVVKLPYTTNIKLAVYNLLGEMVSEVTNAEYKAGTYEFTFAPNGLASGVYVYRIESANFVGTKKMVLLR
jgi:hypothetical protein